MKLLVFAHTPPPHHGQSYMVQLMLDGLGGDVRSKALTPSHPSKDLDIQVYHVNARVSDTMEDIGGIRIGKFFALLRHCFHAIGCRLRFGVRSFYYIPAPPKTSALFRDWIVLFICRPFFPHLILHWHATGLSAWLESLAPWKRRVTMWALGNASLSIVLTPTGRSDADYFKSRKICMVPNGIPDPTPAFLQTVLPARLARLNARKILESHPPAAPGSVPCFHLLFMAHCTEEKGLFDTLEATARSNQLLANRKHPIRLHLTVAGKFMCAREENAFQERIERSDLVHSVTYVGFVSGCDKAQLLANSDLLVFPSRYSGETLPVLLLEAMAAGLPIVTTTWRQIHRLLPDSYPGIMEPGDADAFPSLILESLEWNHFLLLREHFLNGYSLPQHLRQLSAALFQSN